MFISYFATGPDDRRIHFPSRFHRSDEYIQSVVGAGGVEVGVGFMASLLQHQNPGHEENVHAVTAGVHLLGNLAYSKSILAMERFEAMLDVVAQALDLFEGPAVLVRYAIASICNMVECHLAKDVAHANRTRARERGCVEAIVRAMERYEDSQIFLVTSLVTLFHLVGVGDETGIVEQRNAASRALIECGGFEAVVRAMQAYPQDAAIAEKGCMVFFRYGPAEGVPDIAIAKGGVLCVINAMETFEDDAAVQRAGCMALWNLARDEEGRIRTISSGSEMGGLRAVLRAMERHATDQEVVEMALGALWNPLGGVRDDSIRRELAELGGIELIAKALLVHKDNAGIQNEGYAPLEFASRSKSLEVKMAFLQSPHAVPAFLQILQSIPPWWDVKNMTWDLATKHERVSNAIGRLGLMEVNMMGDDEFDGDDEEDEWCSVKNAPFDVGVLLDKGLAADNDDVPGWFKAYPFLLDRERSIKCEEEAGGKKFLHAYAMPVAGDLVCLRVMIPFGGRGYLFGRVTAIGPLPTEDDLSSNGSRLFGKGCPCTHPECRFRGASTRDELLSACGTLHGHEIACIASLEFGHEFEAREKLRHPPLIPFFRGEETKFHITLRFDERGSWEVVRISLGSEE